MSAIPNGYKIPRCSEMTRCANRRIDTLVLLLSLGEFCAKLSKDNLTGHKIEMATTCVLEECDIRRRSPSFQGFAGKIIKVPEHVRFLNRTACNGLQDVPHAIKSGFPPVDKDKGSPSRYRPLHEFEAYSRQPDQGGHRALDWRP
jgi:hypothetical protein